MPKDHWRIQRSITQHKQRASKTKRQQNKLLGIPTSYLSWTWKCIFKVQSTFINNMLLDSNLGRTRIASGRCSTSNGPRRTRLLSLSSSLLDWFYQPVSLQWKQSPFSSLSRQTQQYAITIGYICWLKLRFDALLGISESIIHWQLRRSVPSEKWMLLDLFPLFLLYHEHIDLSLLYFEISSWVLELDNIWGFGQDHKANGWEIRWV